MMNYAKKIILNIGTVQNILQKREIRNWTDKGKPLPPPHAVKQKTIKMFAENFSIDVLVETGTYQGAMVNAMKNTFKRIYSIELQPDLCKQAKARFSGYDHISIIQGDSSEVLSDVLSVIDQPILFWLDGHYSHGITARGILDTPIHQELQHIRDHQENGHIILIDDARLFIGQDDYPTLDELQKLVTEYFPRHTFDVADDIIRIYIPDRVLNS